MSASSRRSSKRGVRVLALLLAAAIVPCPGCLSGAKRGPLPPEEEELLRTKADEPLRQLIHQGGDERFAAVAAFREDVFLKRSTTLDELSILILAESGNAAILLLRPEQALPLLKDPSLRRLVWLGPQGRLARLSPELEFNLLARYGAGTEGENTDLFLRFKGSPGEPEERHVAAAGFHAGSRVGPNWVVTGPLSGLPKLLSIDRIIHIEGASKVRPMPR